MFDLFKFSGSSEDVTARDVQVFNAVVCNVIGAQTHGRYANALGNSRLRVSDVTIKGYVHGQVVEHDGGSFDAEISRPPLQVDEIVLSAR